VKVTVLPSQRLYAPLIDGFARITERNDGSTMYERIWSTPQARVRTPHFRWTPIYNKVCADLHFWPVEEPDEYHAAEINQRPFWRYEEYVGRHRTETAGPSATRTASTPE
jgi:hypothetical protein